MLDIYVAELILSSQNIAYIVTDDTFNVAQVGGNTGFLGVAAQLHHLPLVETIPELVGYEAQLAAILQGEVATLQLDLINREDEEGNVFYVGLKLYPHRPPSGDQISGLLLILEDRTLVGETQQRLTQQHNELYLLHQQLSRANLQLAAANAELRGLDELKSRFVSIAAHELRTPIASLIGYVNFLLEDGVEPLTQTQQSNLGVVKRNAQRLLTITSDLLDVTRLEAGRLELILESINLPMLVQAVIAEFQPQIQEKQLVLHCHTDGAPVKTEADDGDQPHAHEGQARIPPVLCDEKRTIQILNNLLSNAIKYTPDGGNITVQLFAHPTDGKVALRITDSGIGIPAADLRQLGKAFFRAGNVYKARTHGTGLGLHITQSLLELQDGTLHIESAEGKGTTVTVTLPIDDGVFFAPPTNRAQP